MIGTTLDHFKITSLLGKGGMGAVYRAEDTRLGREVAIKVLPEEFTADPERLARFDREAQVIASLNHPNICALYDVGHADEAHYLVMELVEGESLDDRIARGMDPGEAIGLATQIAEALEAAHAKSIVHRDLKPANVMLTADGVVKVLDFGLAKDWTGPSEASPGLTHSPTLTHQMTQAGMIMGTAGYMSPEQARGEGADQRADIWAWGVILYEMMTGRQLFQEPTVSDTLAAVLRADLDWDQLPQGTPRPVRTLVKRCLERNSKNRLHSIADARIELTLPEPEEEKIAETVAPSGPNRSAIWIAALVAVLGLSIGAVGWWTRPASTELPLRVLDVARGKQLTDAAISPDGRRVVLNRAGQLYLRELDSTVESRIPGVEDAGERVLVWSPDGRRIGYATSDEIFTVPVAGGVPQRVCEIPDATRSEGVVIGATWWRPDTIVFALDWRGLWRVPVLGGEPEMLLSPDYENKQEAGFHRPVLLPDGETLIARVRFRGKPNDTVTFLRDGERTDVTYSGWVIDEAVVTSSGHLVFTRSDQDSGIWAAPFSIADLQPTGDPVRLLAGAFSGVTVGSDTTLVTLAAQQSHALTVIADREGNIVRALDGLFYERDLAVSPDGEKIAVWGVAVHDGQRVVEVTPDRGSCPTWSPDGRELIYDGRLAGLLRVPADGSRDPVRLVDGRAMTPHWSPDGKHVAFSVYANDDEEASERDKLLERHERMDISVLELGRPAEPLLFRDSDASEMHPRFSPDGRYLAYASDASGRFEVYVTSFPDGERRWQVSVDGGRFPRWSAGGVEIYFVSGGQLMATSFAAGEDVEIGAPSRLMSTGDRLFRFSEFGQSSYDVTPDGNFAAMYLKTDEESSALLIQNWLELLERES